MTQTKIDQMSGILFLLFGIIIWIYTRNFPDLEEGYPGPALFPRLIGSGFILGGIILVITPFISSKVTDDSDEKSHFSLLNLGKLVIGLFITGLYPFIQPYLGFIGSISLIGFAIGFLLKVKPWLAALVALSCTLIVYFLFTYLLGVPL